MPLPRINFQSEETILKSIGEIAEKIGKEIQLRINDAYYRLVDFEFYVYAGKFRGPHTYKNVLQLQFCKLYLHASGIDITLGDGKNHCGILIRSILRLYKDSGQKQGFIPKQTSGPQNCATELFSNLHPLDSSKQNNIALVDTKDLNQGASFYPTKMVINAKRIGLTPKKIDVEETYLNFRLRYITILEKYSGFKQNIPGIDTIVGEKLKSGNLTAGAAFEILGYNKKI